MYTMTSEEVLMTLNKSIMRSTETVSFQESILEGVKAASNNKGIIVGSSQHSLLEAAVIALRLLTVPLMDIAFDFGDKNQVELDDEGIKALENLVDFHMAEIQRNPTEESLHKLFLEATSLVSGDKKVGEKLGNIAVDVLKIFSEETTNLVSSKKQ